jgi:hypothetical protein
MVLGCLTDGEKEKCQVVAFEGSCAVMERREMLDELE